MRATHILLCVQWTWTSLPRLPLQEIDISRSRRSHLDWGRNKNKQNLWIFQAWNSFKCIRIFCDVTVKMLRFCLLWRMEIIAVYFAMYSEEINSGDKYRFVNLLTPNDPYMGRTAPLTSKRCILYIYSTNIGTEYFKHALYCPFFLLKMQFVS